METVFSILGFIGLGFVLLSFLSKNMTHCRIINIIGAVLCTLQGIYLISSYGFMNGGPVTIVNGSLIFIHLYFLFINPKTKIKFKRSKDDGISED